MSLQEPQKQGLSKPKFRPERFGQGSGREPSQCSAQPTPMCGWAAVVAMIFLLLLTELGGVSDIVRLSTMPTTL